MQLLFAITVARLESGYQQRDRKESYHFQIKFSAVLSIVDDSSKKNCAF
jgi:hypothetical protein